ncbi:MAG: hypothetical protein J6Y37_13470 [Paludibacteraceae bacterium]|nr:hypothetical protein [Paludibacteraceae bacterium]
MANLDYKLQLLSHGEVFPTRQDALDYIDTVKYDIVWSEPALFFYGNENDPKMILAVGASHDNRRPKVCLIDVEEIKELIPDGSEQQETEADIAEIRTDLMNVISATGLVYDDNKIRDKISYEPDVRDDIIGDAKSVAEAVALISQYVQSKVTQQGLTVNDTETIELSYETTDEGSTISASVKVSAEGDDDDLTFNNNIIGVKPDGVFASCNIEFVPETNTLIFTTSGVKNGRFVTDANKKVIELGAHTEYTADNDGHTVNVSINPDTKVVYADLKVSEDDENLLTVKDGNVFVPSRAKYIKYEGTTVARKFKDVDAQIEAVNDRLDNIDITTLVDGAETDTSNLTVTRDRNGGFTVKNDVKLSGDNSIIVSDGGLSANVDITGDSLSNKIFVKIGNRESVIELPGINLIDSIRYDSANRNIIITYNGGTTMTIPVSDLIAAYNFRNDTMHTVHFETIANADGSTDVYANQNINPLTDNILTVKDNGLYVSSTPIYGAITSEADRAATAEQALANNLHTVSDGLNEANANISANTTAIETERNRATTAEQTNADTISQTATNLQNEAARSIARDDEMASAIADINSALNVETIRAKAAEEANLSAISANTSAIATLNGGVDTAGSVRETVSHAISDVTASLTAETNRATAQETFLNTKIDELREKVVTDDAATLAAAKSYADTVASTSSTGSQTYTDTKVSEALATAREYTDTSVTAEKNRAMAAEQANADAITALQSKDTQLETAIATKVSTVEIVKNSTSDLQYFLKVDGVDAGEINIPKDQFLKGVTYDAGNKALSFTFETIDGTNIVNVSIEDLVDTYTAGNGLTEDTNIFSVKINPTSEQYLTVSGDGVSLNGIDALMALKANSSDVYTKTDVDAQLTTETNRAKAAEQANADAITSLRTSSSGLETRLTEAEGALNILNGNEATSGSLAKALKDSKDYADAKVSEETNRATAAEQANANAIGVINGNEAQEGSIKKALADAKVYADNGDANTKAYADGIVATEATARQTADAEINGELSKKVENVTIVQNPGNELQYNLMVDGEVKGTVNIPKDQFLRDVSYDPETKSLLFTFVTVDDTSKEVRVYVGDLVNTYTAGNGLTESQNVFSIKISAGSEAYLSVNADGLSVNGIGSALAAKSDKTYVDDELALKADKSNTYTKSEVDSLISGGTGDFVTHSEFETVSNKVNDNANAIGVINGNEAQEGSIKKALADAKAYADSVVQTEANRATTAEQTNADAIAILNGNVAQEGSVDNKIATAKEEILSGTYTKGEVDSLLQTETNRAEAAEQANADAIIALQSKDDEIVSELATKVGTVQIVKNTASDLQYVLKVDGVDAGEINIPKDQFLKDVTYDSGNKELVFTFVKSDGEVTSRVNISELVDEYTAGLGLSLSDGEFSVKINEDTEHYIAVTEEGIKITGINDALALKANSADVYTKEQSDAKFLTEHQDISALATKEEVTAIDTKVDSITDRVGQTESEISVINGNEAQEGSIKKALKDSKDYTDGKFNTVNTELSLKANSADVYTKEQSDAKYLTEHQDISGLATKQEVIAESNRAITAEQNAQSKADSNEARIATLEADTASQKIFATDTNSVETTVSRDTTGTTISSNVRLNTETANIIKLGGNGLYANVDLSYNSATNTLTFSNGVSTTSMELSQHSLLTDGYYDSSTKEIVLIMSTADGNKTTRIPVSEIVHTLAINNDLGDPIKLSLVTDANGVDTLSADVEISTLASNALKNDNGTLYASKLAQDMIGLWAGEEKSLQVIIELLKAQLDRIPVLEAEIANAQDGIDGLNTRLTELENSFNAYKAATDQRLEAIEDIVNNLIDFGEE